MTEEKYNPTRVTLLVKLKQSENNAAWLEFENIYGGFILSLILRMGIKEDDAVDISQTVLTKVWQKIEDFEYNQNKGKFHNWLAAVTRNTVTDFIRTKKNFITNRDSVEYEEKYLDVEQRVLPHIEILARKEWVLHVTNLAWENIKEGISESQRTVFKLMSQDVSIKETAKATGMTEVAVRICKTRVFKKMREEINRLTRELG